MVSVSVFGNPFDTGHPLPNRCDGSVLEPMIKNPRGFPGCVPHGRSMHFAFLASSLPPPQK